MTVSIPGASLNEPLPTQDAATGQFGELRVVEKTPIVELPSSFGLSAYRDKVTLAGTGTATTAAGEHNLTVTGGTDAVTLDSAERGRYKPGYSGEAGLGFRLPVAPTDSQRVIWGYADDTDGFYFGQDATGLYVARFSGGVETLVRQADWNADKLNGTGASGETLLMSRGNIFQIVFSWYGYGAIEFSVIKPNTVGVQVPIVVHRMVASGSVTIQNPNLPIRVKVSNNGTASALTAYVGGRQFAVLGRYIPNERITSGSRLNVAGITTTPTPILTVRHKTADVSIPVKVSYVEVISDGPALLEIYLNATLTGPAYGAFSNIAPAETALELDRTATALTGGNVIYSALITASGTGSNRSGDGGGRGLSIYIPAPFPVTVALRAITGTVAATALLGMLEEW